MLHGSAGGPPGAPEGARRTPTPDGLRRFMWRHWRVGGDLRPAKDRYVARRGDRVVRWRF